MLVNPQHIILKNGKFEETCLSPNVFSIIIFDAKLFVLLGFRIMVEHSSLKFLLNRKGEKNYWLSWKPSWNIPITITFYNFS